MTETWLFKNFLDSPQIDKYDYSELFVWDNFSQLSYTYHKMIINFLKSRKDSESIQCTWNKGWGGGSVFSSHVGLIGNFLIAQPPKKVLNGTCVQKPTVSVQNVDYAELFYPSHCIQSAIDFLTQYLIYCYTVQCTCAFICIKISRDIMMNII